MSVKAKFKIEGSFSVIGRGLAIYGDLIDGKIDRENFISFNQGDKLIKLKIASVEFVDRIGPDKISKIGLTFCYDDEQQKKELEKLRVTEQIVIITE